MELIYELVYMPGGTKENEDAYVVNKENGIYAAIDGATGLGGISGKIAAQCVKNSLENLPSTCSLKQAIEIANKKLNEQTLAKIGILNVDELPKEERSSCGIAAIRLSRNQLEYVHAGDCMIFIEYQNSEIQHLTYDHLAKLDAESISQFHKIISKRIKSKIKNEKAAQLLKEAREEILPSLIENRRKLNSDMGYGIIDGSNEALNYLSFGQLPLQDAKKILVVSDGLKLPMNKATGISSWEETAIYAFKNGLPALKEEVLRLETSDIACTTYPRLKMSDDKTGILINIQ